LPSLWPRKKNTRGGDEAIADAERIGDRGGGVPGDIGALGLAHGALRVGDCLVAAACVLLAGPKAGQRDLLEAGLYAALVEPAVQARLHQLGDLGHVLEARAAADEAADGEVEAVVVEE